ncbi:MAG: hypothetical protein ACPLPR_08130 [Bacillota bacterium]
MIALLWFVFMFIWILVSMISASKAAQRRTPHRIPVGEVQRKHEAAREIPKVFSQPAPKEETPEEARAEAQPETVAPEITASHGLDLAFSGERLLQAIILSEVLGKPKCLRRYD